MDAIRNLFLSLDSSINHVPERKWPSLKGKERAKIELESNFMVEIIVIIFMKGSAWYKNKVIVLLRKI